MGVGRNFKAAREILGRSQEEIASVLNVGRVMISYYEREETPLTSDRVELLADLLCLTIDEAYHGVPAERELKRRYYTRLLARLNEEAEAEARRDVSGRDNSHPASPNRHPTPTQLDLQGVIAPLRVPTPALAG